MVTIRDHIFRQFDLLHWRGVCRRCAIAGKLFIALSLQTHDAMMSQPKHVLPCGRRRLVEMAEIAGLDIVDFRIPGTKMLGSS